MPTTEKLTTADKLASLAHFTGTDHLYRWSIMCQRHLLTDGAKYVADVGGGGGAYWLMDAIASHLPGVMRKQKMGGHFQVWRLHKNKTGKGCKLTCQEDSNLPAIVTQRIEFTDFDMWGDNNQFVLYCIFDAGNAKFVIMLPREY